MGITTLTGKHSMEANKLLVESKSINIYQCVSIRNTVVIPFLSPTKMNLRSRTRSIFKMPDFDAEIDQDGSHLLDEDRQLCFPLGIF